MDIRVECPYCGYARDVPKEKIPQNTKWAVCPRCKQRFQFFQDVDFEYAGGRIHDKNGAPGDGTARMGSAPWEMRHELGLLKALFQTAKQALLTPQSLFKNMRLNEGQIEPLAFGVLAGSVGSMFSFFWQVLMVGVGIMSVTPPILGHLGMGIILLIMFLCLPLLVLVGLYLVSAIIHVLLLIVGGAKNGFEATFRVVCYSNAAQFLGIVPLVGASVAGIWQVIVQIIGLKEIHNTSYLRVILAFLIPVFLIILICLLVFIPIILSLLGHISTQVPLKW